MVTVRGEALNSIEGMKTALGCPRHSVTTGHIELSWVTRSAFSFFLPTPPQLIPERRLGIRRKH